jgi:hypothetical protein
MMCARFITCVLSCSRLQFRRLTAVAEANGSSFGAASTSASQRYSGFGPSHSIALELEQLEEPDTSAAPRPATQPFKKSGACVLPCVLS